jgi:general L-amino acid transport system permease protein
MSAVDTGVVHPAEKPPATSLGIIGWLRSNIFSSIPNTVLTLLALFVFYKLVPPFVQWALVDSTWSAPNGVECRKGGGACWAFIGVWYRFILFGRYPYEEQWRPLIVDLIFIGMFLASTNRKLAGRSLIGIWAGGVLATFVLMRGGVLGLSFVETDLWNGLPLTLMLSVYGTIGAFILGILLALGRRSNMPAVRSVCVAYIELVRGVPLITVLFMASVMLPLFLPPGTNIDKLLRAQIAIILFAGAYIAEIIRGGLQSLPKGQYEAADSLGLSYARKMRLIILPQALTTVIPPLVNTFIGTFKDTSLVLIIGLYDLLTTAQTALSDANWRGFSWESYIFVGFIYWLFCFFMSKYSQHLEGQLNRGKRR